MLDWVAISSSRGPSQHRTEPASPASSALAVDALALCSLGSPNFTFKALESIRIRNCTPQSLLLHKELQPQPVMEKSKGWA